MIVEHRKGKRDGEKWAEEARGGKGNGSVVHRPRLPSRRGSLALHTCADKNGKNKISKRQRGR